MFSSFQGQHLFILWGLCVKHSNWSSNRRTNHHQSPNFLEIFIQVFATVAVNFSVVVILVDGGWKKSCSHPSRGEGSWNPSFLQGWLFYHHPRVVFSPNSGVWIDGFFPGWKVCCQCVVKVALYRSWRCDGFGRFWKGWWLMYHSVNVGFRGFLYVFY